jgi:hypothetical protein
MATLTRRAAEAYLTKDMWSIEPVVTPKTPFDSKP